MLITKKWMSSIFISFWCFSSCHLLTNKGTHGYSQNRPNCVSVNMLRDCSSKLSCGDPLFALRHLSDKHFAWSIRLTHIFIGPLCLNIMSYDSYLSGSILACILLHMCKLHQRIDISFMIFAATHFVSCHSQVLEVKSHIYRMCSCFQAKMSPI